MPIALAKFAVFAVLSLVGTVFVLVVGAEVMVELVDWIDSRPLWAVRMQSTLSVAFGVLIIWSVSRSTR